MKPTEDTPTLMGGLEQPSGNLQSVATKSLPSVPSKQGASYGFQRLKQWSVMTYAPGKPEAYKLVIWGNYDTLREAVEKLHSLQDYEQAECYIMKNVAWRTEVSEVDWTVTDLAKSSPETTSADTQIRLGEHKKQELEGLQ